MDPATEVLAGVHMTGGLLVVPATWAAAVPVLLRLAGAGQLALAAASLAIPRVLGWRAETARLRPLTRQVFWTYAAYILATNTAFGLVSAARPEWLLGAALGRAVCGFIAAWWGARLVLQLFWFDHSAAPPGARWKLADAALTLLFAGLALVYGAAAALGGGSAA